MRVGVEGRTVVEAKGGAEGEARNEPVPLNAREPSGNEVGAEIGEE